MSTLYLHLLFSAKNIRFDLGAAFDTANFRTQSTGVRGVLNDAEEVQQPPVDIGKQLSKGLQLQAAYTWAKRLEQYPQGINVYRMRQNSSSARSVWPL